MKFEDLQNIFQTPTLKPWEHDYYEATFVTAKTNQEFLDYVYETVEGLTGVWYEVSGNTVYFIVPKGTIIPEDFAPLLGKITDVPEEPVAEGTE